MLKHDIYVERTNGVLIGQLCKTKVPRSLSLPTRQTPTYPVPFFNTAKLADTRLPAMDFKDLVVSCDLGRTPQHNELALLARKNAQCSRRPKKSAISALLSGRLSDALSS